MPSNSWDGLDGPPIDVGLIEEIHSAMDFGRTMIDALEADQHPQVTSSLKQELEKSDRHWT